MINKLKRRVRLLVQIPLIMLIIIIAAISFYLNYTSIINSATGTIIRFSTISNDETEKGDDLASANKKPPEKPAEKAGKTDAHKPEAQSYEALYEFSVKDGSITAQTADDEKALETALSLANGDERSGVKNGFFYSLQRKGGKNYTVKLLQSNHLYSSLRTAMITNIIILFAGILIVVLISIVVSRLIIKPVAENERKQKAFISDTSHELKTPLAVMEANTEVLEAEIGKNKWLGYIQTEIAGMSELIGSLLTLSGCESTEQTRYHTFDLSQKAEACVASFEALAYEKEIVLHSAITPNLTFTGRETDIGSVLSPLIDNAIKHTSPTGNIWVTVNKLRSGTVFTVANEGDPIPEEDIGRIFDRFYRVDKARNRSEKRYGLGLSIVKAVAEQYNGEVQVKCENGVTTFTAVLKSKD